MARIPSGMPGPIKPRVVDPEQFALKQPKLTDKKAVYKTFGETFKDFMNDVNTLQRESGRTVEKFLTGEIENVHDVMVAVEKAGISFELMMEIRNKMIEAYHEVMRMQV